MTLARATSTKVEDCLARIAARDEHIGALLHLDSDGALRSAEASEARWRAGTPLSPIDGLPLAIKANIAVEGWPWTAGIAAFSDRRATEDAACVARLRRAGAIPIGLTNMDEGALGALTDNPWFGRTHNPHRHGFTAGGSSGGSGAAVAADFCAAAIGTDTIGSIRIPAAYCGVVGHKLERGTVPSDGIVPLSPTLDTIGVLARTAGLCRSIAQVLDTKTAASTQPVAANVAPLAGRLVAVPDWSLAAEVQPDIAASFERLLDNARRIGLTPLRLRADFFPFARAQRLLLMMAEIEAAAVHREALRDLPDGFSAGFSAMLAWGAGTGASRYDADRHELATITAVARTQLTGFDAILMPTTPQSAFAFDNGIPHDQAVFATLASSLGDPATAFPIGQSREGLPISAQVMANSADLCLAIAAALTV